MSAAPLSFLWTVLIQNEETLHVWKRRVSLQERDFGPVGKALPVSLPVLRSEQFENATGELWFRLTSTTKLLDEVVPLAPLSGTMQMQWHCPIVLA
jgi:hypothetical protein